MFRLSLSLPSLSPPKTQGRLQQQVEHVRQELEASHQRTTQQLQSRLAELEASTRELTERRYKNESSIRDLQIKLASAEEVGRTHTHRHARTAVTLFSLRALTSTMQYNPIKFL